MTRDEKFEAGAKDGVKWRLAKWDKLPDDVLKADLFEWISNLEHGLGSPTLDLEGMPARRREVFSWAFNTLVEAALAHLERLK